MCIKVTLLRIVEVTIPYLGSGIGYPAFGYFRFPQSTRKILVLHFALDNNRSLPYNLQFLVTNHSHHSHHSNDTHLQCALLTGSLNKPYVNK